MQHCAAVEVRLGILTAQVDEAAVHAWQSIRQWVADAPAHAQRLREGAQSAVEMSPLPRQGRTAATAGSRTATPVSSMSSGALNTTVSKPTSCSAVSRPEVLSNITPSSVMMHVRLLQQISTRCEV